jgi:magnesium transporter
MLTTAVMRDGAVTAGPTDPEALAALLADPGARVWVDIESPTEAEYGLLATVFQFHPLAIEDCRIQNELPKLDDYGEVLFLILHSPHQDAAMEALRTTEVHFFLSTRFLVTVHDGESRVIADLRRESQRDAAVFKRGTDFLLHAVLDRVADQYVTLLDTLDAVTNDLEQQVMGNPDPGLLERVFMVKRKLLHLVRLSHLQREVVHRLSREPFPQIGETARWYFRDVYDHFFQVSWMAEFYRDTVAGVRDAYLSVVSNRLNETMKVLTAFASVVLPLTVVTGIYGMNFDHMPELHWRYGYPAVLIAMAVMGAGVAVYFRRRGWW